MCNIWNLESDFQVFPNQENPNRDSCGNSNVWYFMHSSSLNRDPQTYSLLPNFKPDRFSIWGLQMWAGTIPDEVPPITEMLPHIGINTTGSTQYPVGGVTWLPNTIHVHPHFTELIIVGWRSPYTGSVSITGSVVDEYGNGGDGILWYIVKDSTNLASGSYSDGGTQNFQDGTGGNSLANISVVQGEFIYFIIHPKGNYLYDSTRLNIRITSAFLDLPLQYTNFSVAANGNIAGNNTGYNY